MLEYSGQTAEPGGVEYFEDHRRNILGKYVAIEFQLESTAITASDLESVFVSDYFSPTAIGGIEAHQTGDQWFLGGYALEDFASRFLKTCAPVPKSITYASTKSDEDREYLNFMADKIENLTNPIGDLSPFEHRDPLADVTFISAKNLDISVLNDVEKWISRFPRSVIYLYGVFTVAVQEPSHLPWDRAFRFLFPKDYGIQAIGAPFLFIRIGKSPFLKNTIELMLYSESNIWLSEAKALNGLVGKNEAEQNLANLASLSRLIAKNETVRNIELRVDGASFIQEKKRFKYYLADILTIE